MSVDYYTCHNCEETFCDCGEYVSCECGNVWCSDECAEEEGYVAEHCKLHPELGYYGRREYRQEHCEHDTCLECENYAIASCKYCREEDYEDGFLLEKALELLKMCREDLIKIVKESE